MPQSNILMYTTEDGGTKIEVTFDHDTVWLSIDQMAELFQRDKSVIGKHVRNIFKEGELAKEAVWAKFAYTASDNKTYQVDFYNLDVIISVGYRVKSLRGTQFRIWATSILKEYMKKGFALAEVSTSVYEISNITAEKPLKIRCFQLFIIFDNVVPLYYLYF